MRFVVYRRLSLGLLPTVVEAASSLVAAEAVAGPLRSVLPLRRQGKNAVVYATVTSGEVLVLVLGTLTTIR